MLERMWSKGTFTQCWWEYKLVEALEKSMWQCFRKMGMYLPQDPAIITLGYMPEGYFMLPQTLAQPCSWGCSHFSSWKLETVYLFLNRRMGKENVVNLHNGILAIKKNKIMKFTGK